MRAVVTRLPVLISTVVLSALMSAAAAATLPSHIDRTALDAVEEQRRNYYSYEQSDYRHNASGLSVYRSYLYRAASARERVYGNRQGWRFQRTGLSSLQRYTLSDPANVADSPLLRDLPAGEYAIIEKEDSSADRFKLENGDWTGVDNWNTGTLAFQSHTSGGGHWEQQDESGAVARFNEQGQLLELAANDQHHTYAYNQAGLLTSVQALDGETLTFDYDHADRMSSFTNHRNETTRYEYDSQGRLTAVIKPDDTPELSDNPTEYYQYSDADHPLLLTGIVSPLNYLVVENRYDNATDELVYKRLDQKGGRSTAATNGTVHSERHWSNGLRIRYVNAEPSAITRDGREVTGLEAVALERQQAQDAGHYIERSSYTLENASCLDCIVRGDTHYGPTGEQLKTEELRANGVLIKQEFVAGTAQDGVPVPLTRRETRHGQLVKYTTWSGDSDNNVVLSEEQPGRTTTHQYNESGLRISQAVMDTVNPSAAPRITRYQYKGDQLVLLDGSRTDVNDTVQFGYDSRGNLIKVTNGLSQLTRFEYDQHDRRTATIDANGLRTEVTYGAEDRLLSQTLAAGTEQAVTTRYEYDGDGNLVQIALPTGLVLEGQYDHLGRRVKLNDQNGEHYIDYQYDADGNLISTSAYDQQQGLKLLVKQASGGQNCLGCSVFDSEKSQVSSQIIVDNEGGADQQYDQFGRLISSVDALGDKTGFEYDAQGNIARIVDARGVTTDYEYNGFGERAAEHSLSKGTLTYQYDEAGNVVKETRENGIVIKRQFDVLNRLTKELFKQKGAEKKRLNYRYDNCDNGIGKLCKISGAGSTTRYDYDIRGNFSKVKIKLHDEAQANVTKYEYNEHNQLTKIIYPSGLKVRYHYSANDAVVKITAKQGDIKYIIADNIQYQPMQNKLSQFTFGNSLTTKLNYSEQGQLIRLVAGNVQDLNYEYDDNGNITGIDRPLRDGWKQLFEYDDLNRLIDEARDGETISYEYDGVGNRLNRAEQTADKTKTKSYYYAENSNRLDKINKQELIYDSNGNLIEDKNGKRKFQYDVTNRLTKYFKNGEHKASYVYNASGQRIKKIIRRAGQADDDHRSLTFTYLRSGWLLSEDGRDEANNKGFTRDYVWLGDKPIAQIKSKFKADGSIKKQEISYIHTDHLNTPRVATGSDQNIVWRWDSDAFGERKAQKDPDSNGKKVEISLRFPGQYFDGESKLHYNHYRDYDPKIGRYIQSDPIGLDGGVNRYNYVLGNPLLFSDPEGTLTESQIQQFYADCLWRARLDHDNCRDWANYAALIAGGVAAGACYALSSLSFGATAVIAGGVGGFVGGSVRQNSLQDCYYDYIGAQRNCRQMYPIQ